MAHCLPHEIEDLRSLLDEILKWDKIRENGYGKLYYKSKGFLHFHSKDGRRWADVRDGANWGLELDIPINATTYHKNRFLREVKKRYKRTVELKDK